MAIINFALPKNLERRIQKTIKEKGFPSKAEFFRFSAIRYLDELEKLPLDDNPRITALSEKLEKELIKKIGSKPLPSVKRQLSRLKEL